MLDAERLDIDGRHGLSPLRATEWRGQLTEKQFLERNVQLYRHPYGAKSITTWALRDTDGSVPVSLDILDVPLLTPGGLTDRGGLIASVVTHPAWRGRGLASRLVEQVLAAEPARPFLLYSDIGPDFYRRFGFEPAPTVSVDTAAGGKTAMAPVDGAELLRCLYERRRSDVAAAGPGVAALPSADYLDWVLERYRHAAAVAGRVFPETLFHGARHGGEEHAIGVAPHWKAARAELLWMPQGCADCLREAAALAAQWDLPMVRRWEPFGHADAVGNHGDTVSNKVEWPMVRVPGLTAPELLDAQLLDWW